MREGTFKPSDADVTMWTAHVPYRKDGSPIVGNTFSSGSREMVLVSAADFKKLLNAIPPETLATMKFGHYEMR